ncbi:FkbM family methyltransferase [Luteimonas sp. A534]
MKLAFDIGMYDGADTDYLLRSGFRVVAIEAQPGLCSQAETRFAEEIGEGRLTVANVAIAGREGVADLALCSDDIGSSSIVAGKLGGLRHGGTLRVAATTILSLISRHGTPDFMKIDIEGADRHCILPLTPDVAPRYLSFEVDEDVAELVDHTAAIGYTKFKLIGQTSFLEISRERGVGYRARNRVMKWLGYGEPGLARRSGQWFPLMHSSGPGPWESDGDWYSAAVLLDRWTRSSAMNGRQGWYDVHAMR